MELRDLTSFGTDKTHKLIGIKFDEMSPHLSGSIAKILANNYSTAEAVDMSLNSNIQLHGYRSSFEWAFELIDSPVQASVHFRISVRTTDEINMKVFGRRLSPRVSWHNDIQEVLVVKTPHKLIMYLINKGKFEPCGMLRSYFTGIRIAKIENSIGNKLRPGEAVICDYYPLTKTITPKAAVSIFEAGQAIPENVVHETARLCAVY